MNEMPFFNSFDNLILLSDSYKYSHWKSYMPNTKYNYAYLEARNGAKFNKTVMYGLQYILKRYLVGKVITKEKIDFAEAIIDAHMGPGMFNRKGWDYILEKYDGYLPIKIKAVAEGTPVEVNNVMMTVENTDPNVPWLTNFLETILLQVWYPMTVCTLSREEKIMIKDYLTKTADNMNNLDFCIQDFGFRGATSVEAAMIGGSAHMVNFKGSDTVCALTLPMKYYNAELKDIPLIKTVDFVAKNMPAFSVSATEHSIMTARGEEGEWDVLENIFKNNPDGVLSLVIDSYNYERFIEVAGTRFKDTILNRNGVTVFRPDSGDPVGVSLRCLELLEKYFGVEREITTEYGKFKLLNNKVRLLWGDGIDYYGMRDILFAMFNNLYSAANLACFGQGGGLLQKVDRDVQRFAFKSSAQFYDGEWHDVYKKPKDITKASKRGRLALIKENGKFKTIREEELGDKTNYLEIVFENGKLLKEYTFEEVRKNAKV